MMTCWSSKRGPSVAVQIAALALGSVARAGGPAPFTEEASARGLNFTLENTVGRWGSGVAFADLDNDGDCDVVLISGLGQTIGVFENDGTGNFIDRSSGSGFPTLALASGVIAADYDGDGDLDIHVTGYSTADLLMRNDGTFHFISKGGSAGVASTGFGCGASWGDYDGDGWIDLYVANRTDLISPIPNQLFHNNQDESFSDVAGGLAVDGGQAPSLLATFYDYDLDGDADLYLGNDKGTDNPWTNHLFQNSNGAFSDVSVETGTDAGIDCMGIAVGDITADGLPDMYLSNIDDGNVLLVQQPDHTFSDMTRTAGVESNHVAWSTFFFDYDNDGWLDIYVCNTTYQAGVDPPNRLYDYDGAWPAVDVAPDLGLDLIEHSYSAAYADIDGDGDLDLLVQTASGPIRLFVNHEGSLRRWIRFNLVGRQHNLFAIGAQIELRLGSDWQRREIMTGNNYKSQSELTAHFGAGEMTIADEVRVRWPGGVTRTLSNYPTDQNWRIYPPERLGDADGNGSVDAGDAAGLVDCMGGPMPGTISPGCEIMDIDGNGSVDLADYSLLQRLTSAL